MRLLKEPLQQLLHIDQEKYTLVDQALPRTTAVTQDKDSKRVDIFFLERFLQIDLLLIDIQATNHQTFYKMNTEA